MSTLAAIVLVLILLAVLGILGDLVREIPALASGLFVLSCIGITFLLIASAS